MKFSDKKTFGILFFLIFSLIAIWPIFNGNELKVWSAILSFLFLFLTFFSPRLLGPLNFIWIKFGMFLGKFISPIILGLIFFFFITPIGILMRVFKKDLIGLKFSKNKSYWIKRKENIKTMDKQF